MHNWGNKYEVDLRHSDRTRKNRFRVYLA